MFVFICFFLGAPFFVFMFYLGAFFMLYFGCVFFVFVLYWGAFFVFYFGCIFWCVFYFVCVFLCFNFGAFFLFLCFIFRLFGGLGGGGYFLSSARSMIFLVVQSANRNPSYLTERSLEFVKGFRQQLADLPASKFRYVTVD